MPGISAAPRRPSPRCTRPRSTSTARSRADAGVPELVAPVEYLHVYGSEERYAGAARDWRMRREHGADFEVLGRGELHEAEPDLAPHYVRGVRIKGQGRTLNPGRLVRSYVDRVVANGGELLRAEVTDIEVTGNRVSAVRTGDGSGRGRRVRALGRRVLPQAHRPARARPAARHRARLSRHLPGPRHRRHAYGDGGGQQVRREPDGDGGALRGHGGDGGRRRPGESAPRRSHQAAREADVPEAPARRCDAVDGPAPEHAGRTPGDRSVAAPREPVARVRARSHRHGRRAHDRPDHRRHDHRDRCRTST